MSQDPETFTLWRTARQAKALGATHYGRLCGLVPGFIADDGAGLLWVPRSDLLAPVEWLVMTLWVMARDARGEEPDFGFTIGREIDA